MYKTDEQLIWEAYLIKEALQSVSVEEYDRVTKSFFDNEELYDLAIASRDYISSEGPIETVKTANNFYAQWVEGSDQIFLIGIISANPERKMTKIDYIDLKPLIEKLMNKLMEGKDLVTSPNRISSKLLDNIIKRIEKQGKTVDVTEIDRMQYSDSPFLDFKTVIVSVE